MDTRQLAAVLAAAGGDPRAYRIAGQAATETGSPAEDAILLTGSARTGRWYIKGGQDVVPGWPTVLREFADETQACVHFSGELTRTDRSAMAEEKAAWAARAGQLRAQAEAELARTHPERVAERARWQTEWRRRGAMHLPLMTRTELSAALAAAGTQEPYWIDPGPAEPTVLPAFDPDDEGSWEFPQSAPWPADCFVLAWDGLDECWATGSRRPGCQPDYHLRFAADAEDEACAYVFEQLTAPNTVPPRLTPAQWRALQQPERPGAPLGREVGRRLC